MIRIQHALHSLRPGAEWVLNGDTVDGLIWLTPGVEPLTEAEVQAEMARLEEARAVKAQARADAKASAVAKLEALGLTVEEVSTVFGLEV